MSWQLTGDAWRYREQAESGPRAVRKQAESRDESGAFGGSSGRRRSTLETGAMPDLCDKRALRVAARAG